MRLNWFVVITDLTGSADGSVRLWEWEHQQPLTVMRAPGTFPKVTKVLFNQQGNKVTFFFRFYRNRIMHQGKRKSEIPWSRSEEILNRKTN